MEAIQKNKLLTGLIVVLIAMNLGLMAFMWLSQRNMHGPDKPEAARYLIKELKLNETQQQEYHKLQDEFRAKVDATKDMERHEHDRFFEMLHAEAPDSALVSQTIDSMADIRRKIEFYTFDHFRKVRALCTPEQRNKFDQIIANAMRRMGPPPPGRGPDGPPPNGEEHGGAPDK